MAGPALVGGSVIEARWYRELRCPRPCEVAAFLSSTKEGVPSRCCPTVTISTRLSHAWLVSGPRLISMPSTLMLQDPFLPSIRHHQPFLASCISVTAILSHRRTFSHVITA